MKCAGSHHITKCTIYERELIRLVRYVIYTTYALRIKLEAHSLVENAMFRRLKNKPNEQHLAKAAPTSVMCQQAEHCTDAQDHRNEHDKL